MSKWALAILLGTSLAVFAACRSATEPPVEPAVVDTGEGEEQRITITDRTGYEWDITHAVKKYGFVPEQFQFGIGRGTIAPVFDPQFIGPGEQGYPNSGSPNLILGADIEGDTRGYLIFEIAKREVINDTFGEAHLTVAY